MIARWLLDSAPHGGRIVERARPRGARPRRFTLVAALAVAALGILGGATDALAGPQWTAARSWGGTSTNHLHIWNEPSGVLPGGRILWREALWAFSPGHEARVWFDNDMGAGTQMVGADISTSGYDGTFGESNCFAYGQAVTGAGQRVEAWASHTCPYTSGEGGGYHTRLNAVTYEDVQGPAASITGGPAASSWITGAVGVSWSTSDNAHFTAATGVLVTGGSDTGHGNPGAGSYGYAGSVTPGAEGLQYIYAYRDGTGGWGRAYSAALPVYVDLNAPSVPQVAGVPGGWSNTSVTATATGSDDGAGSGVAGYEYTTDGGASLSANVFTTEGVYALQARAVDGVGRRSAWSPIATVRIDTSVPTVSGLSSTHVPGNDGARQVSFTNADTGGSGFGAGQQTSVEANIPALGGWTVVAQPNLGSGAQTLTPTTSGYPEGRYQWRVRTRDQAGSLSAYATVTDTASASALVVDRSAPTKVGDPVITALTHPNAQVDWNVADAGVGLTPGGANNIRIEAEEPAASGTWVTLANFSGATGTGQRVVSIAPLGPGQHAGRITFTDDLGHMATFALEGSFANDTTPPNLSGFSVVPHPSDPAKAILTFTADDGSQGVGVGQPSAHPAQVHCNLGTGWVLAVNLNATPTPVSDGANTHTIDTSACPQGVAGLGEGLRLTVSDKAGNPTQAVLPASAYTSYPGGSLTIDRTAPTLSGLAGQIVADGSGRARFSWSVSDLAPSLGFDATKSAQIQVQDTLDANQWKSVGQVAADGAAVLDHVVDPMSQMSDGQLTSWRLLVPDRAGNVATLSGGAIRIDRAAPVVSAPAVTIPGDAGTAGWVNGRVDVAFGLADAGAGLDPTPGQTRLELLDGATWTDVASGSAAALTSLSGSTLAVAEGLHQARLVARDQHGYVVRHAIAPVLVDHSAPQITLEPGYQLPGQKALVRFTGADAGVGFAPGHTYSVHGRGAGDSWVLLATQIGGAISVERVVDVSGLPEGQREFRVSGSDQAGRVRQVSGAITIDRVGPVIAGPGGSGAPSVTYPSLNVARVCWTLTDPETGPDGMVEVIRDGHVVRQVPALSGETCIDIDLSGLSPGAHPFLVSVKDKAGNQTILPVTVHVDNDPPRVSGLQIGVVTGSGGRHAAVTFRQEDQGAGIDPETTVVEIAPGAGGDAATGEFTVAWAGRLDPAEGEHTVIVDMSARQKAAWVFRVRITDKRGNAALSTSAGLDLRPNRGIGEGNPALVAPGSHLTPAPPREILRENRGNATHDPAAKGGVRFRVRYPKPGRVRVLGRFTGPDGQALAQQELRVYEANLERGTVRTDADGRFAYSHVPAAPGALRVVWPGFQSIAPIELSWEVEVIPHFVSVSPARTGFARRVTVTGRFLPGPSALQVFPSSPAKAGKKRGRRGQKARGGQPVALVAASAKVCPRLRRAMGLSGGRASRAGIIKALSSARVPARCWVPIAHGALHPDGRFSLTYAGFPKPPGAGAGVIYGQLVQVRVLPGTGWPFPRARARARVVVVGKG